MEHDLPLRVLDRVGVVGAGQMGSGIAASLVRAGVPTALIDVNAAMLDAAVKTVWRVAAQDPGERPDRLVTATSPAILANCDVVIEAITEDEAAKMATFRNLAGILREGTILASNTSTIPISRMARSTADPERFAGMHFFHPAHRMELVEVIRGEETGDQTVATLVALAGRLGKTPIVVRDCPGFSRDPRAFPLPQPGAPAPPGGGRDGRHRRGGGRFRHADRARSPCSTSSGWIRPWPSRR